MDRNVVSPKHSPLFKIRIYECVKRIREKKIGTVVLQERDNHPFMIRERNDRGIHLDGHPGEGTKG